MNEIEKLYENCNIQKVKCGYCSWHATCPYDDIGCGDDCPYWKYEDEAKYPPFTAEKQIELIKWLATRELKIKTQKQPCVTYIGILGQYECFYGIEETHFEQALAGLINILWQDLTKEEKEQIRSVLNANI